jgi:hypothetical membrane protein
MDFSTFRIFGLFGTSLVIISVLLSAIFYRGRQGEHYSPLNHFVSELGELGVSSMAKVFNVGFIVGGLALVPYMIGLGIKLESVLGWVATAFGVISSLACSAVGIFPMNNLTPHARAAMTFFRAGLAMIFFYGLAILFQSPGRQVVSQSANILSLLAFCSYAGFLIKTTIDRPRQKPENDLDPQLVWENRPKVSMTTILEWAIFVSTILWIFGTAFFF